jgi:polyisoprenoid-binding protein YceI
MRPLAILLVLALAACGATHPRPPPAPAPAGKAAGEAPPPAYEAAHFRIDAARSELRVLVYRAGPMASLGHNHVIASHALEGWATYDGEVAGAAFAFTVPVASLEVDDPSLRAEEGPDFAESVTEEAKSGTLHNLLGPAVLDAADFPAMALRSSAVAGAGGALQATLVLEVAGHSSTLVVPFALDASPGLLIATGEVTLSQTSLGLTPFSIFLGALKVQDDLRVKFKLVAEPG